MKNLLKKIFSKSVALLRGCFYILKYRVASNNNIAINFPFYCYAKVKIIGPGKVFIGPKCAVFLNNYKGLTIVTRNKFAIVFIGSDCSLGGTTIRCAGNVKLGDRVMTAASLIQDYPFFFSFDMKSGVSFLSSEHVSIGDHVWLGARSIVLFGSNIGRGSVLGTGAVVFRKSVGEECLALGNLIRRPIPIEKLFLLKGVYGE